MLQNRSAPPSIDAIFSAGPVIPVLAIANALDAVPLARALHAGGIRVIEVTLRTDAALGAVGAIAREVPEMMVGAGTILFEEQANAAAEAGARFLVSPGLTQNLARVAASLGLALLPGVATTSEIMMGLELRFAAFKFFPAETSGGPAALKALHGPFPNIRFCPTGGVSAENSRDYLALPNVVCVGGSWLAPKDAVADRDWARIEALARAATRLKT
jgi:2-dehydro-3-deoxyphosphogluconate aldolase/(4S)-4-hydroxy-2-oxoglutarate aldolase